jgi:hypothetical protein
MNLRVGDTVVVNGERVKIVGRQAAGKHVHWTLEDGRTMTDLHKNDAVEIVKPQLPPLERVEPVQEVDEVEDDDMYPHRSWRNRG